MRPSPAPATAIAAPRRASTASSSAPSAQPRSSLSAAGSAAAASVVSVAEGVMLLLARGGEPSSSPCVFECKTCTSRGSRRWAAGTTRATSASLCIGQEPGETKGQRRPGLASELSFM
ncbi:hypothetical protein U9M48_027102 [Paspalum notatum var. saurae]|uniref:Uncharacterized protein n=1 Tax=Paspalum notatum var. saurae TaxID=547442 RepID=A0AAQ3TU45_PASNO